MTEASRVQKMLNEQNAWIDQLKSEVMRLELQIVCYRTRNTQLEAALREITWIATPDQEEARHKATEIARKALEGEDE